MEITYEFVREMFDYDAEGFLVWTASHNNQFAGRRAGGIDEGRGGYWYIQFARKNFMKKVRAHRLIFLWHHGHMPATVDHINRNKTDNRIENLRAATHQQQAANRTSVAKSGYKGVYWYNPTKRWLASITVQGEAKHLGYYTTPEEAHAAYTKAAKEFFGEFATTG